ncbi:MAG: hypothetical protein ACU843_15950 [Gammaproteobacteria bacterium]
MTIDLLDFEVDELYFDEALHQEAKECLERAAQSYGKESAETALLRAYFLEPEHPVVLVGLYRYFYYRHRLADALLVAERVLRIFAKRLNLPESWNDLDTNSVEHAVGSSMPGLRFYLLALKGAGYLQLRLGKIEAALACLRKVAEFDPKDQLGAKVLIDVARSALQDERTESLELEH